MYIFLLFKNSRSPLTHSVLKPRLKPCIKWSLNSIRTVVVWLNSTNSSRWWSPDHQPTNQDKKFIKFSLHSTTKRQVKLYLIQVLLPWKTSEELPKIWENLLMTTFSKKWSKELILTLMDLSQKRNSTTLWPKRLTEILIENS